MYSRKLLSVCCTTVLCLFAEHCLALELKTEHPPANTAKHTALKLYVKSEEVYKLESEKDERKKYYFVDIRTKAEVQFVGMFDGIDAHIPYVDLSEFPSWDSKKSTYKLDVNSNFALELERKLTEAGRVDILPALKDGDSHYWRLMSQTENR